MGPRVELRADALRVGPDRFLAARSVSTDIAGVESEFVGEVKDAFDEGIHGVVAGEGDQLAIRGSAMMVESGDNAAGDRGRRLG